MGMSSIRTALGHLQETGEISVNANYRGNLITVNNYEMYQSMDAAWYVKLFRKIRQWRWYGNTNTKALFFHLLLTAEYKPETVDGKALGRGQLITRIPDLSKALGMSAREIRTALAHLVETGEISDESDNRGRVITICKYDDYQGVLPGGTGEDRDNSPVPAEKATGTQAAAPRPMRQADLSKATGTYDVQATGKASVEDGFPMPNVAPSACAIDMPETACTNMPLDENPHAACRFIDVPVNAPSFNKNLKNLKSEEGEETRARALSPCIPTNEDDALTIDGVAKLYLQLCPSLPPVSLPLTLPRRHHIAILLRQYPDRQTIHALFQKAESSAFLKGADGKWKADFDWLIDPTNASRVLEGKYDVLWEKTPRPGGYMPVSELEPTYDMQEYVDLSIKRILES
ncbi:hypothetical protein [Ethanoligenens harbinense]|nr:hypothetical protein [Ethanoligenens harbinense]